MSQPPPSSPTIPQDSVRLPSVPPVSAPAGVATGSARLATVAAVNWSSVLEFTQIFRGFRLAINPAKVLIALIAILLIYTGGRTFDFVWGFQVFDGEIGRYQTEKSDAYRSLRDQQIEARRSSLETMLELESGQHPELTTERIDQLRNSPRAAYRELKRIYEREFLDDLNEAHERRVHAEEDRSGNPALPGIATPREDETDARAAASRRLFNRVNSLKLAAGSGIFASVFDYEIREFDALVDNTLTFVRVSPVRTNSVDIEGSAVSGGLLSKNPERIWQSDTVVGCIVNMTVTAPAWLFSGTAPMQWHPAEGAETWAGWMKMIAYRGMYLVSLLLLAVMSLIVLALAGAAITRLTALEIAGIERAPLRDVLMFAASRLWVFVKAPVMPFLILLAIGVLLGVAGIVGAIPFIGEILLGIFFVMIIVVAFVMMLLLLGILGGFHLLYPTIAVEGSDAFDAMSRAFAYVYARPWRLFFYSVISLIYGVITFLFISFAIYLVLLLSHTFVGWGTSLLGFNHGWYSGIPKLDTLWPMPEFSRLIAPTNWYAMSVTEFIGSLFLHFWVYMLITCIGAYVMSYYFSTHTIIYLLLRRSVDGQAITEVFIDDAPAVALPAPAPTGAAAPAT
ncbi:MAG TPA: hypothetical protein VM008_00030 [Phycisphaerae bacterium]|nr:hypothetical protein [Phycisphaerae bacterium]